jgi:Fe-S cluster assembly protein SufD
MTAQPRPIDLRPAPETSPASAAFEEAIAARSDAARGEPGWLAARRGAGWGLFRDRGLPGPRDEAFKYTLLRPLERIAFVDPRRSHAAAAFDAPGAVAPPATVVEGAWRAVLVNGRFRPDLCDLDGLPDGVRVCGLADLVERDGRAAERLMSLAPVTVDDGLVGLAEAMLEDGVVVEVEDGVRVERAIEVQVLTANGTDDPVAVHPRLLCAAGAGSLATVVERHAAVAAGAPTFSGVLAQVSVGAGATLHHYKLQDEGPEAFHVARAFVRIEGDGHYDNFALTHGARLARNEIRAHLDGTGIMCRLSGAYAIAGQQHADTTTFIDHAQPGCGSREVYKGAIDDRARAVFQGKILVRRGAQKTDGYQLNNALLLSEAAEIDSKPELEIYADDVKCSHGATAGEIDEDQLFYLRARGIPVAEARALLIRAFLADAVEEVQHEGVREAFARILEDRLARSGGTR